MAVNYMENVIRTLQAGQQFKMRQQEAEERKEQREIERTLLKHRMDRLKIEDKLTARKLQLEQAQLMQGMPGKMRTEELQQEAPTAQVPQGVPEGAPGAVKDILAGRVMEMRGAQLPGSQRTVEEEHPAQEISGVPEMGVGGFQMPVLNQSQAQQQAIQQKLRELRLKGMEQQQTKQIESEFRPPVNVPEGGRLVDPNSGEVVAEGAPRKQTPGVDIPFSPEVAAQRLAERTAAARAASAANRASGGLPRSTLTQVDVMSRAFESSPIVKNFNEIQNKYQSVKGIIDRGGGGPSDLAIVYEFMKGIDPTSVVRETEYATAAKSGNIFSGAWARFNGYLSPQGGFLSPQVKKEFQALIKGKLDTISSQYKNYRTETARKINKRTGQGDGAEYLTDFEAAFPQESQGPIVQQNKTTGAFRHSIDGGKTWINGKPQQ